MIVEALGGRWSPNGALCRCPAHADRTASLSVRPGRSRLLFHCFAGCPTADVLAALRRLDLPASASIAVRAGDSTRTRTPELARRLWAEGRSIEGTVAERYLGQRGLDGCSRLRFHPRVPWGPWPVTQLRPALLTPVHTDAGLVAIQRALLPANGWTPGLMMKRANLGALEDGCVRLADAGASLGLAEGLETALSAMTLFGMPIWATLGVERFGRVTLPAAVERIVLFLDNDAGGRRAERLALEHFAGRQVVTRFAPVAGGDWNQVLLNVHGPLTDR